MLQNWAIIVTAFAYIGLLFMVASYGDRLGGFARGRRLIYPLSLAIYCTSWTFFGSVGLATRTGVEFLAIYIGPVLMIGLCTPLLLRIVKLAKSQNTTSIADFIAARYGKSQAVAATVAIIAIIGSVPYIALQLKAVAGSLETILAHTNVNGLSPQPAIGDIALSVTMAMATFAVLFGTRHTDATEHQNGLVLAIAAESIIKLVAFLAAGFFITFWIFGPLDLLNQAWENPVARAAIEQPPSFANMLAMTFLSFCAIMLLPRQFHVSVVENHSADEVVRARWLFPLYLVAINLFVIPITLAGLVTFAPGSVDTDMYVLALPIAAGSPPIAVLVFIGGLSAATAMVIVECVALAIMVSNDLVMPLLLKRRSAVTAPLRDATGMVLKIRRVAIFTIMLLAYFYYRSSGNAQLASIGLLSFAAVAQFAPAFFGGLFWRGGTARGAIGGMTIGFVVWAYTLLLPSFADAGLIGSALLDQGPFGIQALRPQGLLGSTLPPLIHGVMWSLALNILAYVALSFTREPAAIERLQAEVFVPPSLTPMTTSFRPWRSNVSIGDLIATVSQYLGPERTRQSFDSFAATHRIDLTPAAPANFQVLRHAEHLIASVIGAASSRLVLSLMLRKRTVSAEAAMKLIDDAHAALHYSREILQTALDHVRQGIAVFNRDQELICWNRQFGEVLDLPASIVQVGASLPEILQRLPAISPGGNPADVMHRRLQAYTTPGDPYLERFPDRGMVVEVRTNRMPDGGYVITFSDITPSVEAAEALERANASLEKRVRDRTEELTRLNSELARAKGTAEDANISKTRFLAAASHDILQPLNAARLYATSLVQRESSTEAARLAGHIDQSLESIEDILVALLEISRLDAGALKPSVTSFSVENMLRSLDIEFAPLARQRGLELTVVPSTAAITTDRVLMRRLLQNLVSNAIKYTETGRVLVGCRRRGKALQIDVYDTGLGIPRGKRSEIFKEFNRLDQGARMARGLGLGLSIVERIARVLNHGLALESEPGRGSHFSITVPLSDTITPSIPMVSTATPKPMEGSKLVCIDNEPAILDGMRTLLTGWGAEVTCAANGAEAIALLKNSGVRPTGLLVDYRLDDGNGIDAIAALRAALHEDVPAILITADRSQELRDAARTNNILVSNKPVKISALRAMIGRWRDEQLGARETAAE